MEHNPFISITVTPGYSDGHLIQWRIDPTFYSTGTYDFYVEIKFRIKNRARLKYHKLFYYIIVYYFIESCQLLFHLLI